MRLALVLLYAHFFLNGALSAPANRHAVVFDVTEARCTQVLEPLLVAAQVYDVVNTRNQLARYPQARETDWWTSQFAGPQRRNIIGIAFGIALMDVIKWRATAHSPALRCVAEAGQFVTTLDAIRFTRPR